METNLDSLYKTNGKEEKEGIWYEINDEVSFKVKRFGGENADAVKRAMAKHYKPYAARIEKGTLEQSREDKIMAKVFVEACLIDWKGVEIDGEVKDYNQELAVDFFVALPELRSDLFTYATSADTYKEDLGNS